MKIAAALAVLALLFSAAFAGVWYQERVSGDFKRTIVALVDPSSTKEDVQAYLREARLRARTNKDRQLLEKAERAIYLDRDADRLSDSNFAALMKETKDPYEFSGVFYKELELARVGGISPSEARRLNEQKLTAKETRARNSTELDSLIADQKHDAEESRRLFDELRVSLNAPGKGRYVANMEPTYDVLSGIKKQNDGIQKITEDHMDQMESDLVLADSRLKTRRAERQRVCASWKPPPPSVFASEAGSRSDPPPADCPY
jgi:hypothetical protein